MSDDLSPVLSLPLIQPAQAQKHVTHNEALRMLDVLVQLAVASRSLTAPPAFPADGARWIVAPGATADWAGQDNTIALRDAGGWAFFVPMPGWTAHVADEDQSATWTGTLWQTAAQQPQRFPRLGIATDADAINRLAVSAPATLFTHDGAGHQVKLNKAGAGDTASLLFQTGWSGRAEIGTLGDDDFGLKVSPDGSAWTTALQASRSTGNLTVPAGLSVAGAITGTAVTQSAQDSTAGRLLKVGDYGLGSVSTDRGRLVQGLALPDLPGGDTGFQGGVRFLLLGRVASNDFKINGEIRYGRLAAVTTHADQGRMDIISHRSSTVRTTSVLNRSNPQLTTRRSRLVSLTYDGVEWLAIEAFGGSTAPIVRAGIVFSGFIAGEEFQWVNESAVTGVADPAWGVPFLEFNNSELFRRANILGPVSQSGGVPTGAVIETGSNANGTFTRLADGTQLCWATLTAGSGAATTWTFPAAFAAAPAVGGTAQATVLSAVCLDAAPTATAATFSARSKTDTRRADPCHLTARGRWF